MLLPILVPRQDDADLAPLWATYAASATRTAVERIDLGEATATAIVGEARPPRAHRLLPRPLAQDRRRMDQSYTIDPDVAGSVTLSLLDVPTEMALQAIVRAAHASYRAEGGVYQVFRPETPPATKPR